jgi:hypothetical protein
MRFDFVRNQNILLVAEGILKGMEFFQKIQGLKVLKILAKQIG